jgi:hypothetical protein
MVQCRWSTSSIIVIIPFAVTQRKLSGCPSLLHVITSLLSHRAVDNACAVSNDATRAAPFYSHVILPSRSDIVVTSIANRHDSKNRLQGSPSSLHVIEPSFCHRCSKCLSCSAHTDSGIHPLLQCDSIAIRITLMPLFPWPYLTPPHPLLHSPR